MGNLATSVTTSMATTLQSFPHHGMIKIEEMSAANPVLHNLELISIDETKLLVVNPASFLVIPIWYLYQRFDSDTPSWFWSPYDDLQYMMKIDEHTVTGGSYKGHQPAQINIDIIHALSNLDKEFMDKIFEIFKECDICMCIKRNWSSYYPCQHMSCHDCAHEIYNHKSFNSCPFCRQPVECLKLCHLSAN